MKILIVGCGRVGSLVARKLSLKHDVTVVDWRQAAFDRLGAEFGGASVLGNGIDVEVLRDAGVDDADLFLALTDGDNRNLMMAQTSLYLGAKRAVARVYDAVRGDIFSQEDLIVYSPTENGARRLFNMVVGQEE